MKINRPNNIYISKAIDFLDTTHRIVKTKNGKKVIESKYNTYISGFGGSIIQSGLLATLMIFEANAEKNEIIEALFTILNSRSDAESIAKTEEFYFKTVKEWDQNERNILRNDLIEMAVALKLAMRCFEQVKNYK